MALYAIGDIHGCIGTLDALLTRLDLTPEDHVVFVGDYIDRGPDSYGVVNRMIEMRCGGLWRGSAVHVPPRQPRSDAAGLGRR